MDAETSTADMVCSPGLVPTVPQVRPDKPTQATTGKPTENGANSAATAAAATAAVADDATCIDACARSKTASCRPKKRKKKSSITRADLDNPSVALAADWTDRQEQMEEVRALEAAYLVPRANIAGVGEEETPGPSSHTGSTAGNSAAPVTGTAGRIRRPWEWSAKDCDALFVDAVSNVKPAGEALLEGDSSSFLDQQQDLLDETRGSSSDSCLSTNATASTRPRGGSGVKGAWGVPSSREYSASPKRSPGRRVISEETLRLLGNKLPSNTANVSTAWTPDATGSATLDPEPLPSRPRKARMVAPNQTTGVSAGKANARKDERTARELSAALNRNKPRTRRPQDAPGEMLVSGESAAGSSPRPGTRRIPTDDEREAKELSAVLNRNVPRLGRQPDLKDFPPEAGPEEQPKENDAARSVTGTELLGKDNGAGLNHPWISYGLNFGKGTLVEVRWDDQRWYRCSINSVSAGGRYGVLEFFPYRRKHLGREYSTQLDLDAWIQAGNLVRPGTHLKWD